MKSAIADRDYTHQPSSSSSRYRKVKYEDEVRSGSMRNNNGHNKFGDYNTSYKISRKSPSSVGNTVLKIVTVGLIVIAVAICYLSQLNSQDQQRVIKGIRSKVSTVKDKGTAMWDYFVSSKFSTSSSRRIQRRNQVETGINLLKHKDPFGAESICKLETERDPSNMEAWVCLGEARLALHNSAWSSGLLVEYPSRFIFDKLVAARENFEMAVGMKEGPTCAEARLGLGLSLFLMATRKRRMETKKNYLSNNKESTSQLLFDSILHLNAAASLTSPSALMGENEDVVDDGRKIHMAATYNSAIAHLALGDTLTAAPLLEEVASSIGREYKKKKEEEMVVHGDSGVVIPDVNLVGTYVQRGAWKKAAAMVDTKHCLNTEQYGQHDKLTKLCAIIMNNAGIIQEGEEAAEAANGDEKVENYYRKAVEFERDLLRKGGFSSINYQESGRILRLYGEDENGEPAHVGLDNVRHIVDGNEGRFVRKEGSSGAGTSNVFSSQSFYDAISALEESAIKNPTQSRLWLSLSKAKLRSGDRIGAVEAGTNAMNSAKTVEELEAANELVDAALGHHNFVPDALSSTSGTSTTSSISSISSIAILQEEEVVEGYPTDERSYVEALRLEREILMLKLQILQESLHERDKIQTTQSATSESTDASSVKDSSYSSQSFSKEESSSDSGHGVPLTRVDSKLEADLRNEKDQVPTKDAPSMEEFVDVSDSNRSLGGDVEESEEKPDMGDAMNLTNIPMRDEDAQNNNEVIFKDNDTEQFTMDQENIDLVSEDMAQQVETSTGNYDEQETDIIAPENHDGEGSFDLDEESLDNELNYSDEKTDGLVSSDMESGQNTYAVDERVDVPNLYQSEDIPDEQISSSALSYMKMADAYLQKQNFKSASKQFLKVLKKFPFHIPALLGYATSLERIANSRQLVDVVMAYTNVTRSALALGNENLAEASLRRATSVSRNIEENRVDLLREVARLSFTNELAAEAHFELGMELLSNSSDDSQNEKDAISAFLACNEYARRNTEDGQGVHGKSLVQLGKLALERENNPEKALLLLDQASSHDLGDLVVECLVYSARSKYSLGDREGARVLLERAIAPESPRSDASAFAYHLLAVIMKELGKDSVQVERNMEMALNLGLDVTPEAMEVLGEHNIAVIKSVHRAEWKRYQQSAKDAQQRQGGIMSGASVGSTANSIFTSQGAGDMDGDGSSSLSGEDPLAMLKQGAASYDGSSVPSGDEIEGDSVQSIRNVNHQSRAKVNSR